MSRRDATARGWRSVPGGRPVLTALALAALLAALIAPLSGLLNDAAWVAWYLWFGWGILAIGATLRALRVPGWLVPLLELAVIPPAMIACFARDTAILGVIPWSETPGRFVALGREVGRSILMEAAPISVHRGVIAMMALAAALLAVIFDWYAFTVRAPAAVGLFAALAAVVPIAFLRDPMGLWTLAVVAAAYLLVLAVATPTSRPRLVRAGHSAEGDAAASSARSLAVIAGSVAAAMGLAWALPGLTAEPLVQPGPGTVQFVNGVNPLVELGRDLKQTGSSEVLRYTTDAGHGLYMRLTSVSEFDGTKWTHAEGSQVSFVPGTGRDVPVPPDTPIGEATTVQVNVDIGTLRAQWLPVPYIPVRVASATGTWQVDQSDLTIAADGGSLREQDYRVTAALPAPAATGGTAGDVPPGLDEYLLLPDDLPAVIPDTADRVTAGAGPSALSQAQALQDYFRGTDFTYSTKTPAEEGYDGDSGEVIARFLEVKEGYCVHFAAAMALMARSLGIPSRIALGYLPGTRVSSDGQWSTYSVKANLLHSWPELYLPGSGWVGFEPTVSRATAPSYAPDPSGSAGPSQSSSAPSASASPSRSASSSAAPATQGPTSAAPDAQRDGPAAWTGWPWALGGAGALVVVALVPAGWRALRRLRRRGRLRGAWDEVRDTAVDLRLGAPPEETPAEFGARIAAPWGDGAPTKAMNVLVSAVERNAYAAADAELPRGPGVRAVLRAMRGTVPRVVRFWAAVAPRSLRRRR